MGYGVFTDVPYAVIIRTIKSERSFDLICKQIDVLVWCGLSVDKGEICWGTRWINTVTQQTSFSKRQLIVFLFTSIMFFISHLSVTCSL